ncbi:MAG: AAA family ATPase [Tissierellia bacterium]|nr:AAA family ATPase [Tissierellia bacterium]
MLENLLKQGVSRELLKKVEKFVEENPSSEKYEYRIPEEKIIYMGKQVWEQAISAILQGQNILLVGAKSTGKNLFANNLAMLFNRPSWNVSFNINTDESHLIGVDSFKNNEVIFRDGPISLAAKNGGFAVLDEINMAKNEAISVIYSSLDDRKMLDIPGYDLIKISNATRFIATMNYGYLGTRDLNEALVSRFMVIDMPNINEDNLKTLILSNYEDMKSEHVEKFVKFFKDIELKVINSEISSKALDLRGLLSAIGTMKVGLNIYDSLKLGILNKTFDEFEKELLTDLIKINIPKNLESNELFNE